MMVDVDIIDSTTATSGTEPPQQTAVVCKRLELGHVGLGHAGLGHVGLGHAGLGHAGLGHATSGTSPPQETDNRT